MKIATIHLFGQIYKADIYYLFENKNISLNLTLQSFEGSVKKKYVFNMNK